MCDEGSLNVISPEFGKCFDEVFWINIYLINVLTVFCNKVHSTSTVA